jgi:hypothetical protein
VVHIEPGAIAALASIYDRVLPRGKPILDLMSSWRSHLPDDPRLGPVTGLGMNAAEMADNPRLSEWLVMTSTALRSCPSPTRPFRP